MYLKRRRIYGVICNEKENPTSSQNNSNQIKNGVVDSNDCNNSNENLSTSGSESDHTSQLIGIDNDDDDDADWINEEQENNLIQNKPKRKP